MSSFNVALVGCGNAGPNRHIPAIQANPKMRLVACCDLDERRLRKVAGPLRVAEYTDYMEMVESEDLDAVHLCTPPQTHLAITQDLLEAGVPVLIEKPVAMSSTEVDELIETRDRTGTPVSVVHNRLFLPYVQDALDRIASGEIGDVVAVTMVHTKADDLSESIRGDWVFDLPGGDLGEGSPHQVYVPLAFVNGLGEVRGVTTQNYRKYEEPIEFDGASIQATDTSGDRLVTIKMLANSAARDTCFVHGTDGELQVDFVKRATYMNTNMEQYSAKGLVSDSLGTATQVGLSFLENAFGFARRVAYRQMDDERSESANGHYLQMDAFVRAIESGSEVPVTLEEAKETVEVLEALE